MGEDCKSSESSNNDSERTPDKALVPLGIELKGSIARSIARILVAIATLIEELISWMVRKLRKN